MGILSLIIIYMSTKYSHCLLLQKLLKTACSSVNQLCPTLCEPRYRSMPGFPVYHITNSRSLLKFMTIESGMPSKHLIFCCPLLFLPSIFPSTRVFSSELDLHVSWPKYWSFSFSIIPSNEYSGLISFRTECFDLLAIQRTLKSLLQHHSSKALILQCAVVNNYDFITHNNFLTFS